MFRRKDEELEDTLFKKPAEAGQAYPAESATVVAPQSSAASGPTGSSNSGTITTGGAASAPSAPGNAMLARPMPEARPSPPSGGFRPNANPMAGNRMPEAKANPAASTGSSAEKSKNSGRRVLTVGNDILLKGEIATCDRLVIEGKVDATLNDVHTVEIAETGSFKGSAHIEDAEISGLFEGDLTVRNRLVIYATGKVRGKISYGEIEIERGGELTGEIKATNAAQGSTGTRPAARPTGSKEDKFAA